MDGLFKGRHFDQEIIVLCVRWYLRYKLSFRDLAEMMAERGLSLAHTTIMRWSSALCRSSRSAGTASLAQLGGPGASMRPTSESEAVGRIFTRCRQRGKHRRFPASRQAGRRRRQGVLPTGAPTPGPIATQDHARRLSGVASRGGRGSQRTSRGKSMQDRSSKYVNNLIEQDHRSIKLRLGPMLGLKHFRRAATTIAGIELMHWIRKGQFKLDKLRVKHKTAPEIWNAVLAA